MTSTSCYHYDGLGNVTSLTSNRGYKIAGYTYDAYGNTLRQTGVGFTNKYKYSSKEYSPKSGLVYFGARYYDPRIGRWVTPDPLTWGPDDPRNFANLSNILSQFQNSILLNKGILNPEKVIGMIVDGERFQKETILQIGKFNPQYSHRYLYVSNNPINRFDPLGLCGISTGQQFFSDLSKYAGVTSAACFFAGVEPGVIVFGGIWAGAKGLELSIYSRDKIKDTLKEIIKAIIGSKIGETAKLFTDEIIEQLFKRTK